MQPTQWTSMLLEITWHLAYELEYLGSFDSQLKMIDKRKKLARRGEQIYTKKQGEKGGGRSSQIINIVNITTLRRHSEVAAEVPRYPPASQAGSNFFKRYHTYTHDTWWRSLSFSLFDDVEHCTSTLVTSTSQSTQRHQLTLIEKVERRKKEQPLTETLFDKKWRLVPKSSSSCLLTKKSFSLAGWSNKHIQQWHSVPSKTITTKTKKTRTPNQQRLTISLLYLPSKEQNTTRRGLFWPLRRW